MMVTGLGRHGGAREVPMRAVDRILVTAMAAALLTGSAAVMAAQSPAPQGVLVIGEFVPDPHERRKFAEQTETDGVRRQRDRASPGRSVMSDARLSGEAALFDNADRYTAGEFADILWGSIEIVNERGSWFGRSVGTTDLSAEGRGITYFELVGSGDYEGLSAVLFQRETEVDGVPAYPMNGVIFPGDLPPDR